MNDFRTGYDPNFLGNGHVVPLPEMGLEYEQDVLRREKLRDEHIADYIHYSLVMSASNRQAFFTAANLDQEEKTTVPSKKGRRWFVDSRIGLENQIPPRAYQNNPWDRGHLTRRTAVTWGGKFIATKASNDSCSYANATLQHKNFNQDEWRVPEKAVDKFKKDSNDKLCVFTGPIFTDIDRWYSRLPHEKVRIPSAFWKIVAFLDNETGKISSQAWILPQDDEFIQTEDGQKKLELRNYQVTTTEIERRTGIEFPRVMFESNPLLFFANKEGNVGPEMFESPDDVENESIVFSREDINDAAEKRRIVVSADDFEDVLVSSGRLRRI